MLSVDPKTDRGSDAPMAFGLLDDTGNSAFNTGRMRRSLIPSSWIGMSGYLAAGVFLGLILILALSFGRRSPEVPVAAASAPAAVTDNIVRLHAREIGSSCWRDLGASEGPARVTVTLEVGTEGRVRFAAVAGASPTMRGCVEAHVRSWEFLPQARPQTMNLPVEIDRR